MTQEDINDLIIKTMPQWQQKQLYIQNGNKGILKRLINKAVQDEREACALICEDLFETENEIMTLNYKCADAIRKRSK